MVTSSQSRKLNKSAHLLIRSAIVNFSLLRQHRAFVSSSQFMPLFLPELPSLNSYLIWELLVLRVLSLSGTQMVQCSSFPPEANFSLHTLLLPPRFYLTMETTHKAALTKRFLMEPDDSFHRRSLSLCLCMLGQEGKRMWVNLQKVNSWCLIANPLSDLIRWLNKSKRRKLCGQGACSDSFGSF